MKNKDFIKRYVEGTIKKGAHGRMACNNGRLISYNTPICDLDYENKLARVNIKKYSRTTDAMQKQLLEYLKMSEYTIETYEGPEAYIWNAYDARRRKVTVDMVK